LKKTSRFRPLLAILSFSSFLSLFNSSIFYCLINSFYSLISVFVGSLVSLCNLRSNPFTCCYSAWGVAVHALGGWSSPATLSGVFYSLFSVMFGLRQYSLISSFTISSFRYLTAMCNGVFLSHWVG
jgi:hypothetical protein